MTSGPKRSPSPLAALSHEFRTPLNAVLGMARLLEGTRLTAEQKNYVTALKKSGDHLLTLVNDILDLARLEAGVLTLNPAPLRMDDLLQTVAELLSPRAHEKGLEIAWWVPPGMPPVLADEGRLRQVLFNLTGNAIKYTETGGIILGCELRKVTKAGARIRLYVRDSGPGIADERQAHIFDAFTQADERDSARTDSSGIGLAIVSRLAQAHQGDVGLVSKLGKGAEFWFEATFPVEGPVSSEAPLKGLTIAIASPSAVLREVATRQIETAGGTAIAFKTIGEAARETPQDAVVLIDNALFGRTARLRPLPVRGNLILLPPEERRLIAKSRAAGFDGYLIKPLRQVSLVERVRAALGHETAEAPAQSDERARPQAAKNARVLLVEDNPINALLANKLLEREGCRVELVGSAEDALRAAARSAYDLILMDRRLPGDDGVTATRKLRAAGVTAPIVALTADAFEEDRQTCLAAGMDDFLTKPLDPHALRGLLARTVSGDWTNTDRDAKLAS